MDNTITTHQLKKSFEDHTVFENFSIKIKSGTITAVFGPNGCGKSTLLQILSGVLPPDEGTYTIENFDRFRFSYIFQNYRESLHPWRSSYNNIAYPLCVQKQKPQIIKQRIQELKQSFNITFDLKKYPYSLSGGQQQIVAFLRAIITEPMILFIDEPFSALDYENTLELRDLLLRYYLKYKPTIILITHAIEEAVYLAEKIIVLSKSPMTITETIHNPIPYPRTRTILDYPEFQGIKTEVLSAFHKVCERPSKTESI